MPGTHVFNLLSMKESDTDTIYIKKITGKALLSNKLIEPVQDVFHFCKKRNILRYIIQFLTCFLGRSHIYVLCFCERIKLYIYIYVKNELLWWQGCHAWSTGTY